MTAINGKTPNQMWDDIKEQEKRQKEFENSMEDEFRMRKRKNS
jgi:hypothetical protein